MEDREETIAAWITVEYVGRGQRGGFYPTSPETAFRTEEVNEALAFAKTLPSHMSYAWAEVEVRVVSHVVRRKGTEQVETMAEYLDGMPYDVGDEVQRKACNKAAEARAKELYREEASKKREAKKSR